MKSTHCILVVDDETESRLLTVRLLERAGYSVLQAETGKEGLEIAREQQPDLILLNVALPGLDGYETCRRLKSEPMTQDLRVIMLSLSKFDSDAKVEGLETGADGYIARPIPKGELLARIRAVLRLHDADQALRRYESIISAVSNPISYVDRDYVYRTVNETYARYAQRPRQEILGLTVAELHGTEAFEQIIKPQMDRCFAGDEVHYQAWFDVPGRGRQYMDVHYAPVFAPNGEVVGAAVSSRDVSAEKQAEEALSHEGELLRQVMETSPVGIIVLNSEGQITFANRQIEQLTGLHRDQILESSFLDSRWPVNDVNGQPMPEIRLPFPRVMDTREPLYGLECVVQLPELGSIWLSLNAAPILDEAGKVESVVITVEDVTERRRTEQALIESRAFFQSALDALSANIAVLDEDGQIVAVNASWCKYGGENALSWEDCGVGRNYLAVLDGTTGPDREYAQRAAQGIRVVIAKQQETYWLEYPCHSPTEKQWFAMSVTRFEGAEGVRVVTSHVDVTERKLAELGLIEAKEAAEQARQEEKRRREIAESLGDILSLLNSNRPLQEVLDYIAIEAGQRLSSQAVAIYRQEDGNELALQAAQGAVDVCESWHSTTAGLDAIHSAISARSPVAISDVSCTEPQSASPADWAGSGPYSALLAVPIDVQDHAYGGILLYYANPHSFTDDEVELALLFGDQMALAIENARLREEVQEAAVAEERNRLARELHDAVTQTLFSASVIAESLPRIWERYPEEAKQGLVELRQLTRGALAEMRTLLLELRPTALTEKPLSELIRNLAEAMVSRTRVPVSLDILHDEPPPPEIQIVCYRIAQEALNNVSKHAAATQVEIALSSKADRVSLTIQDNGAGFDLNESRPGHLGLGIMQERAQRIGAQLTVDSAKGQGTSVALLWQEGEQE